MKEAPHVGSYIVYVYLCMFISLDTCFVFNSFENAVKLFNIVLLSLYSKISGNYSVLSAVKGALHFSYNAMNQNISYYALGYKGNSVSIFSFPCVLPQY